MTIQRRQFLGHVAAGSAILTMPGFLSGCGVTPASEMIAATPPNPFMEWFGVDEPTMARVMAELAANGADTADLYFQHQRTNMLAMEDGMALAPERPGHGVAFDWSALAAHGAKPL